MPRTKAPEQTDALSLTIPRAALHEALSTVARTVPSRSVLPVTLCVLIEADDTGVRFRTTDLDATTVAHVPADGLAVAAGASAVPHKLLADLVGALPDGPVTLAQDKANLNVTAGSTTARLRSVPDTEFPPDPVFGDDATTVALPGRALAGVLTAVAVAAAGDDSRPVLNGVLVRGTASGLTVAAADGFRLHVAELDGVSVAPDVLLIVPERQVRAVIPVLQACREEDVSVTISDRSIRFDTGRVQIVSRLIEGTFPAYGQIIPATSTTTVRIEHGPLREAIRAVRAASGGSKETPIRFHVDGETLTVHARSEDGTGSAQIAVSSDGPDIEIALNPVYVADALTAIGDRPVRLNLNNKTSPALITPADATDVRAVVMPMFVQGGAA